jgi:hypothetical protein
VLDASSKARMDATLEQLCAAVGAAQPGDTAERHRTRAAAWLAREEGWVLVVDNVHDADSLRSWLGLALPLGRGHVVVTSRSSGSYRRACAGAAEAGGLAEPAAVGLTLGPMSEADGTELLFHFSGADEGEEAQVSAARGLCRRYGCFTLMLQLVGSQCREMLWGDLTAFEEGGDGDAEEAGGGESKGVEEGEEAATASRTRGLVSRRVEEVLGRLSSAAVSLLVTVCFSGYSVGAEVGDDWSSLFKSKGAADMGVVRDAGTLRGLARGGGGGDGALTTRARQTAKPQRTRCGRRCGSCWRCRWCSGSATARWRCTGWWRR